MKLLCFILHKILSKINRIEAHVRGYYFSKIFKSCGRQRLPRIYRNVVFTSPQNIECGEDLLINPNCCFVAKGGIVFGDRVWMSTGVKILTSGLPVGKDFIHQRHIHKKVVIGDNVWLATDAKICPGVTIGSNVIIAAGAVVTRDIPDNCIAAGVPARVIRDLTQEELPVEKPEQE